MHYLHIMKRFLIILSFGLLLAPLPGWAQRVNQSAAISMSDTDGRIAAVVNDNVISTLDINARMKLAMLSSGLPDSPEVRQRLLPQILRSLIDEQLQLQETKRLDIFVGKDEIDKAMERISTDNKIPGGDIRAFVKSHGGSPEALEQQIKAGISWSKVVARELRPRVEVGDDEVDAVIERIRANAGKEEYLVSEIVLAVDNPKDEDQVKEVADNLVQQLKNGANFGSVARQFSQGTGAATGGDIGWIQEGQLPQELNHALTTTEVGQIAGPIRSSSGYHIIGLREKRTIAVGDPGEIKVGLQQAFRPFDEGTGKDSLLQEADHMRTVINSCDNLQNNLADKFPAWKWNNLGDVELGKAPPQIAEKVRDLNVGQASEPIATDKGALVLFVCSRHVPEGNINREAVVSSIGTEKLELQARRLLRDLRRGAYIDVRLGHPAAS